MHNRDVPRVGSFQITLLICPVMMGALAVRTPLAVAFLALWILF